ncbi:helix-turn-helix domain-containing protein [Paenibacillus sp. WQ 127069]|uniref:Helix-turn-helix domain-containing protein n=1 Tax=Paenibacillus baimaensis TaxID=2982185 RepID=A0ABT2UQ77_9BACL|nr:helix-turn-helix domain-containing protein [Paenibacillus sp. WQ 127069]MCU6796815.1 helix-turn-helix domain-containing protein [Paenibacillus sp. WQ 127069]
MQDKIVYSVNEMADLLGVSTDSIYAMVRENTIPSVRIRRRILFYSKAIEGWLEQGGGSFGK